MRLAAGLVGVLCLSCIGGFASGCSGGDSVADVDTDTEGGAGSSGDSGTRVAALLVDAVTDEVLPHFALRLERQTGEPDEVSTDAEGRFETRGGTRAQLVDHPGMSREQLPSVMEIPPGPAPRLPVEVGATFELEFELPADSALQSLEAVLQPNWHGSAQLVKRAGLRDGWNAAPLRAPAGDLKRPWVRFARPGPDAPAGLEGAWLLVVRSRDGLLESAQPVSSNQGRQTQPVQITLAACARITGVVLGPDGPVKGAAIAIGGQDGSRQLSETDSQGAFHINWIPPGRHLLRASDLGYQPVVRNYTLEGGQSLEEEFFLLPFPEGSTPGDR